MAEGKKSFIMYCDIIHTVSHLDDQQAGRLFKHIVDYVNDKNPETDDIVVKLSFEPIKQQLKRDLRKWDGYIEKQRVNGAKGGRPKETQKTQPFFEEPKKADNVNVNVNVNDNVNDSVILSIERCAEIGLVDNRWIKANKIADGELLAFNNYLEQQGKYLMNPLDYKMYFAKLKGKYPELLKPSIKELTVEQLRQMAKELDKQNKNDKQPSI